MNHTGWNTIVYRISGILCIVALIFLVWNIIHVTRSKPVASAREIRIAPGISCYRIQLPDFVFALHMECGLPGILLMTPPRPEDTSGVRIVHVTVQTPGSTSAETAVTNMNLTSYTNDVFLLVLDNRTGTLQRLMFQFLYPAGHGTPAPPNPPWIERVDPPRP